jgi:hypothetical protein
VPEVGLRIELSEGDSEVPAWTYSIKLSQQRSGTHAPEIVSETVTKNGEVVLSRPDDEDRDDPLRLSQTHLEQISANKPFRAIAEFLQDTRYVHLVPQLIRKPEAFFGGGAGSEEEAFGYRFLEHLNSVNERTRSARLRKIENALRLAVPQLRDLELKRDEMGIPHLEAIYEHWRSKGAGRQRESQFSDGTIRLIGLLWSVLDARSILLLEEPELSLHPALVRQLAPLIYRVTRQSKQNAQVLVTTHSPDLLDDPGIAATEILILQPTDEGTKIARASDVSNYMTLLESGLSPAEIVIPVSAPAGAQQLSLFGRE